MAEYTVEETAQSPSLRPSWTTTIAISARGIMLIPIASAPTPPVAHSAGGPRLYREALEK